MRKSSNVSSKIVTGGRQKPRYSGNEEPDSSRPEDIGTHKGSAIISGWGNTMENFNPILNRYQEVENKLSESLNDGISGQGEVPRYKAPSKRIDGEERVLLI